MWVQEIKRDKTYYTLFTVRQMLAHLQAMCGGLHSLGVLALQNKMQRYHIDIKSIPGYIKKLKDVQAKAERANNPITDATLVIIATNVMLSTEQSPQTN